LLVEKEGKKRKEKGTGRFCLFRLEGNFKGVVYLFLFFVQ